MAAGMGQDFRGVGESFGRIARGAVEYGTPVVKTGATVADVAIRLPRAVIEMTSSGMTSSWAAVSEVTETFVKAAVWAPWNMVSDTVAGAVTTPIASVAKWYRGDGAVAEAPPVEAPSALERVMTPVKGIAKHFSGISDFQQAWNAIGQDAEIINPDTVAVIKIAGGGATAKAKTEEGSSKAMRHLTVGMLRSATVVGAISHTVGINSLYVAPFKTCWMVSQASFKLAGLAASKVVEATDLLKLGSVASSTGSLALRGALTPIITGARALVYLGDVVLEDGEWSMASISGIAKSCGRLTLPAVASLAYVPGTAAVGLGLYHIVNGARKRNRSYTVEGKAGSKTIELHTAARDKEELVKGIALLTGGLALDYIGSFIA